MACLDGMELMTCLDGMEFDDLPREQGGLRQRRQDPQHLLHPRVTGGLDTRPTPTVFSDGNIFHLLLVSGRLG